MKKKILTLFSILLFAGLIVFVGNVIVIAGQIMLVTNIYCVYGFYAVLLALFIIFVAAPIIRMVKMPQISKMRIENQDKISANDLYAIGQNLSKHFPDERKSEKEQFSRKVFKYGISQRDQQLKNVMDEINKRFENIDNKIKRYGKSVFILTAISQNNRFDTISVLIMNFRMIKDLIDSTGFSPGYRNLIKIYYRVLMTGAFAYAISDVTDMADETYLAGLETEVAEKIGSETLGKLLGILTKSIADGAVNGLFTLRLGYVTKHYLEEGFESFKDKKARVKIYKQSLQDAWKLRNVINETKLRKAS
ncbi:MAG: DUF697 domain-containing protein [Bacteroidales bacterium]|nr:DUF697 domain-containing protein [Bacteroidales bacterium]